MSLTEHSITIQGDKRCGLLALDNLSTNQGDIPPLRRPSLHPPLQVQPPSASIPNVPLSPLRLAMHACHHPMNDQPSGCHPWPSSVCLTDTCAISACRCNQSRPSARDHIKPLPTERARFLSLYFVFVRSFAICMAVVWVNTTSALSADN